MIKQKRLPADIGQRLTLLEPYFANNANVIFAYIFGSMVAGITRPLADLDMAVYLGSQTDRSETKLDLVGSLSEILGTDEFDLVILNDAPLSLVGRIVRNRRIVIDKQPFVRHAFESCIMREFFDFSRKEQDILFRRFA